VLGDGEQIRCFTNIYDVADAIARFSLNKKAENSIFNIGNPEPISVKELARKIIAIGKEYQILDDNYTICFRPRPIYKDDVKKRIPDVSKMSRTFDWDAGIKIDQSLRMYMKHKFNPKAVI